MDAWSEYQRRGLWGEWSSFFSRDSFALRLTWEGATWVFRSSPPALAPDGPDQGPVVFRWQSRGGIELQLAADKAPGSPEAARWQDLLEYESILPDEAPTFMPFLPPAGGLTESLNSIILNPPEALILNGQPGTGKFAILQALLLLHARIRMPAAAVPLLRLEVGGRQVLVAHEVALLEPAEQQEILKRRKAGGFFWGATHYDLDMLLGRKILSPAFGEMAYAARQLLPPLAGRNKEEIDQVASFWRAFYGVARKRDYANFDFLRRRVLGGEALSVESILEEGRGLRGVVAEFEKEAIRKAQARVGRSQHKIARLLKISRGSLQHKLRKYGMESYATPDADTEEDA